MGWPITKPSTIYAIRCTKTSREYIGRTCRLEERIREHFYELRKGQKNYYSADSGERVASIFQKDYIKYGEDAFEVYILEENVPPELCKEREAFWIAEYHSSDPVYGYNKLDEQDKFVMREPKRGFPPNRYAKDCEAKKNAKEKAKKKKAEADATATSEIASQEPEGAVNAIIEKRKTTT